MDTSSMILRLLEKQPMKPAALAAKLGISRQALHRHLRQLLAAKRIAKHGMGPHVIYASVRYGIAETRIEKDYHFCTLKLLPQYSDQFAGPLQSYGKRLLEGKKQHTFDFEFLLDTAAVYSSKIEGNTLDLNSFLNSRMSPKQHRPREAQEIEDLVAAYDFARGNDLSEKHVLHAHRMLSREFVAPSRRGIYRREPVGVFSSRGLEYMAVEPHLVSQEMRFLFAVISELSQKKLSVGVCFFWAAWIHLMIALIHPFSDGNGRTARLCEKWFLAMQIGEQAFAVPSEKRYWNKRPQYYAALKLGVNYWEADMAKALPFFFLLPRALGKNS